MKVNGGTALKLIFCRKGYNKVFSLGFAYSDDGDQRGRQDSDNLLQQSGFQWKDDSDPLVS